MIDVVLTSAFFDTVKIAEPLGLSYLAAELRQKGFSVEILEPSVEGWSIEETVNNLCQIPCKVLGISLHRDKNLALTKEFVCLLKQRGIKSFICIGGHGPSIGVINNLIQYKELGEMIDCYLIGEGEKSIVRLVDAIVSGIEWKDIDGVAYVKNEEFIVNPPPEKIKNLDEVPFMERDTLEKLLKKYGTNIPASILLSRGCAYNRCTYCTVVAYENLQKGSCYRQRSVKNVVDEIQQIHKRYGITEFNFEDDNFILPGKLGKERVSEFCDLIGNLDFKLKFTFFCRIDAVEKDIFERLTQVGLFGLYLGIESVNGDALRFFNKGLTKERIVHALDTLISLGFSTEIDSVNRIMVGYICWHPYTTLEELKESSEFIQKYKMPPKLLRRRLRLYTGSSMIADLRREGLLDSQNKSGWKYNIPWMKQLEELTCNFIDTVNKTRDVIRTVEKAVIRFDKCTGLKPEMECYRKKLDYTCFEYFDQLIKIAECNNNMDKIICGIGNLNGDQKVYQQY
jgi:anaerobic magnesium-protoporphyrin IX monomethyl ester cyclase